jgi:hypothetical protein
MILYIFFEKKQDKGKYFLLELPNRIAKLKPNEFLLLNKILNMKLDGKSIQAAIMHLVEEYRLDPYQVMEIIRS